MRQLLCKIGLHNIGSFYDHKGYAYWCMRCRREWRWSKGWTPLLAVRLKAFKMSLIQLVKSARGLVRW
jgi:hypothetical protein